MERTKRLYVLAAVLAAICIITFCVSSCEKEKEEIKTSGEVILELDSAKVNSVSWNYGGQDFLIHKSDDKSDDSWVYASDEDFPVDKDAVEQMLSVFESFSAAFAIENPQDLGQYGLSNPEHEISIETDEENYTIAVGDISSMDQQRYVSIGDGNVYLVTEDPLDYFDTDQSDLIAHDDVPNFNTMDSINSMEFSEAENYKIVYDEDSQASWIEDDLFYTKRNGTWVGLKTSSVYGYLDVLTGLDLTNYVTYKADEDQLEEYGLDAPKLVVSVDFDGSWQLSVSELSEKDSVAYARVNDSSIIYEITETEYEDLMACSFNDLRHSEILSADFDYIEGITVSLDGSVYELTSEGEDGDRTWYYEGEEIDIDDFRTKLNSLTASEFADDEDCEENYDNKGKLEISLDMLLNEEDSSNTTIKMYRYDGSLCCAEVDGTPFAFTDRGDVVDLIEAVNEIVLGTK